MSTIIAMNCKTWNNAEPSRSTIIELKSPVEYVALYVISQSPVLFCSWHLCQSHAKREIILLKQMAINS